MKRFIRGCHYGFDSAQKQIAEFVCEREGRCRQIEAELKQSKAQHDLMRVREQVSILNSIRREQIILRRLQDAILAHAVLKEPWILRRMQISDQIARVDPEVVRRTLEVASERNREDRSSFHVISDLTTAVQIGDLIRIQMNSEGHQWEVLELKEGCTNQTLGEVIRAHAEREALDQATQNLSKKQADQLRRMLRQKAREKEIQNFRTVDKGIDPETNSQVYLRPDVVRVEAYSDAIRKTSQTALKTGVAVAQIDGCLRIIAVSERVFETQGQMGIAHLFYHQTQKDCKLDDPDSRNAELSAIEAIPPFFDLLDMNLFARWPVPVFMWPADEELIFDIVFRRVRIYAQLDFDAFFDLASQKGLRLQWSKRQDALVKSHIIPGSPKARSIIATNPDHPEWKEQVIFEGFIGRMFLEFMPPRQIISLILGGFRSPHELIRESPVLQSKT